MDSPTRSAGQRSDRGCCSASAARAPCSASRRRSRQPPPTWIAPPKFRPKHWRRRGRTPATAGNERRVTAYGVFAHVIARPEPLDRRPAGSGGRPERSGERAVRSIPDASAHSLVRGRPPPRSALGGRGAIQRLLLRLSSLCNVVCICRRGLVASEPRMALPAVSCWDSQERRAARLPAAWAAARHRRER